MIWRRSDSLIEFPYEDNNFVSVGVRRCLHLHRTTPYVLTWPNKVKSSSISAMRIGFLRNVDTSTRLTCTARDAEGGEDVARVEA